MAENTAFFSIKVDGADKLEANLTRLTKRGNELRETKKGLTKELKALDKASNTYTADSTALNNSLAKTNISLKENNTALNKNQKEYIESSQAIKTNTGSLVEMRAQLKKSTATYDRLSASQRNNVEIGGKHKKRIQELSASLKEMEGTTGRAQRNVGNYGTGLKGFAQKVGGSFKKLGATITGAFVGLFALQKLLDIFKDGISTVREFEKSLSELKAITNASDSDIKKFSASARKMGRDTTKSATQVAEAFTVVGSKRPELLKSADALIEVTESAVLLSEAAGIDIPEAAEAITLALNQFGDSANSAASITDTLAAAAKEGSVMIPELAKELSKFGGVANNAGLSIQQSAAAVEVVGKTVEQSGTKLRNVLIKLESGVDRFKPSVVGLETALDNLAKDGFEDTGALAKKFGTENAEGALSLIKNRTEVSKLTKALSVQGEALRQAQAQTDNFDGASKRLGSAIDELYLSISSTNDGQGGLKDITNTVAIIVNKFTSFLNKTNSLGVAMSVLNVATELIIAPFKALINTADAAISSFVAVGKVFASIGDGFDAFKKASKDAFVTIKSEAIELATETKNNVKGIGKSIVKAYKAVGKEVDVEGNRSKKAEDERLKKASESRKKAREKESKEQKKAREDKKTADEKLSKETLKNNQETLLLEIKDKQTAEDKKLEIERESAVKSIEQIKGNTEAKRLAIESVNAKFDAKEEVLRLKRIEDDKVKSDQQTLKAQETKQAENDKKLEANAAFELQVKQQAINIAGDAANALVGVAQNKADREKDIELANLNAQLENGLISQSEFEAKKLEIEKKAFAKKKKLELANVAIALATEIANIQAAAAANPLNAVTFGASGIAQASVLTGLAVAKSAIQAGVIASQKFERGGVLQGSSHENGGIPFSINGQSGFEAEGGETLINKESSRRFAPLLSAINQAGGGVALSNPNTSSLSKFRNGGTLNNNVSLDNNGLSEEIQKGVVNAIQSIKIVNVAEETTTESNRVKQIENINTF